MKALSLPSDADLPELARQVCDTSASQPFGAYYFRPEERGSLLARHLERRIFLEAFGNTPDVLTSEYGPYESHSLFICVIDHLRETPAGMIRVLLPSPAGFKSLNDLEAVWGESVQEVADRTGLALDFDSMWDVATMGVAPEYRGMAVRGLVTMGLYQGLTLAALDSGIEWLVAIMDLPVYRLIRWKVGMTWSGYKGVDPLPYLGSPSSIPAWCSMSEADRHLAATDSVLHDILGKGVGLEPVMRPVDLSPVRRLVASRREAVAS